MAVKVVGKKLIKCVFGFYGSKNGEIRILINFMSLLTFAEKRLPV